MAVPHAWRPVVPRGHKIGEPKRHYGLAAQAACLSSWHSALRGGFSWNLPARAMETDAPDSIVAEEAEHPTRACSYEPWLSLADASAQLQTPARPVHPRILRPRTYNINTTYQLFSIRRIASLGRNPTGDKADDAQEKSSRCSPWLRDGPMPFAFAAWVDTVPVPAYPSIARLARHDHPFWLGGQVMYGGKGA
jgi:hypothetical protein